MNNPLPTNNQSLSPVRKDVRKLLLTIGLMILLLAVIKIIDLQTGFLLKMISGIKIK